MKMCLNPFYLNGNYIPCYRCYVCKSNARKKCKDYFTKSYKKSYKKIKQIVDIPDYEEGQKEFAENGEPIC